MNTTHWYDKLAVSDAFGRRIGPFALVAGVLALLAFGVFGVARTMRWLEDYYWFYAAGYGWIHGVNPYTQYPSLWQELYDSTPSLPAIAYPPQAALPFMAFAWMEFSAAQIAWFILNLAFLVATAALAVVYVRHAHTARPSCGFSDTKWLLPALLLMIPPTLQTIWIGQPTFIVVALVMGAWLAARYRYDVLAGILLGLATFKPQFAVLITLWFLLDRRWALLSAQCATSLLAAAYVVITMGAMESVQEWLSALAAYRGIPFNTLGSYYVLGLPSVLTALGWPAPGPAVWLPIAGGLVIALYLMRRRFIEDDLLGLIMGVHLFIIYGHSHELLFLTPMITAFWLHLRHRPAVWIFALCVVLVAVPERLVMLLGSDLLMHWKTGIVLIGLICLSYLSTHGKRYERASATGTPRNLSTAHSTAIAAGKAIHTGRP